MSLALLCKGEPLALPAPGVYFDMDRATYDRIPAFSQTVLKKWIELGGIPKEFEQWLKFDRNKPSESEALLLGSMLDCCLLERHEWDNKFVEIPDDAPKKPTIAQRRAKKPSAEAIESIAYWDAFESRAEGKQIVKPAQVEVISRMAGAIMAKKSSAAIIKNSRKAVAIANLNGFPCKCEFDLWSEHSTHLADLKAMEDVGTRFGYAFKDYGYDKQATFYLRMAAAIGQGKEVFDFLCVKNDRPYSVKINSFAPGDDPTHATIEAAAWVSLYRAMMELSEHLETNTWRDATDYELIPISRAWTGWAKDILQQEAA